MDPTQHIDEIKSRTERPRPTVHFPPDGDSWFTARRVEYLRDLFQMIVFAIAIPYLMMRFFKMPLDTIKVVGKAQVTGGA